MAANDGDHPVTSLFGVALPGGTGAAGTASYAAEDAAPLMRVPVTIPGASSQIVTDTAMVSVGDTDSMSSDAPVPSSGDPLTGLNQSFICDTGAHPFSGNTPHPNSPNRAGGAL